MNSDEASNSHFEQVEQAFVREAGSPAGKVWTDVVLALRRHAQQSTPSAEQYRHLLFRATLVLQELARATGRLQENAWSGKLLAVEDFWRHASYRNLVGLDPIKLEIRELVNAFGAYLKLPMQTPYLDWVFIDAYLYHVCFACKQDVDEDRLGPWDTGRFLPRIESMIASASDEQKVHPLLLDMKMTLIRGALGLAPTAIGVTLGLTLLYFDWWKTGTVILVILLCYRVARAFRWMRRTPLRRRARAFIEKLFSAYGLLGGLVISTKELRRAVDDALQTISGERLVFGVEFWAVLDHVCEAYPSVLNRTSH